MGKVASGFNDNQIVDYSKGVKVMFKVGKHLCVSKVKSKL